MDYWIYNLAVFLVVGCIGITLMLQLGYGGLFNLSHATVWGLGAYSVAIVTQYTTSWWSILITIVIVGGFAGVSLSGLATRLTDEAFALASLALAFSFTHLLRNTSDITGGSRGLYLATEAGSVTGFFSEYEHSGVFGGIMLVGLALLFTYFVTKSPYRIAVTSVREDHVLSEICGIDPRQVYSFLLVPTCILTVFAGWLYLEVIGHITPGHFNSPVAFELAAIVVIGGSRSAAGTLAATAFYALFPELSRILPLSAVDVAIYRQMVFAIILLGIVLWRPTGLIHSGTNQSKI